MGLLPLISPQDRPKMGSIPQIIRLRDASQCLIFPYITHLRRWEFSCAFPCQRQWYALPRENETLIGLMSFPYTEITDGNQVILTC